MDAAIVACVAACAAVGVYTGFAWQFMGFVGTVAGVLAGIAGAWLAGDWLNRLLWLQPPGGEILAFFFLFGAIGVAARVAAGVLRARLGRWQLERQDRLWGALAGAAWGGLAVAVAVTLLASAPTFERLLEQSIVGRNLAAVGTHLLPANMRRAQPPAAPHQRSR